MQISSRAECLRASELITSPNNDASRQMLPGKMSLDRLDKAPMPVQQQTQIDGSRCFNGPSAAFLSPCETSAPAPSMTRRNFTAPNWACARRCKTRHRRRCGKSTGLARIQESPRLGPPMPARSGPLANVHSKAASARTSSIH
jgi:hypothetical protein